MAAPWKLAGLNIILEKAVGSTHIAQPLDLLGYMKKVLITNEVTTHFFITPFKSISYTLYALPTALSRFNHLRYYLQPRKGRKQLCSGCRINQRVTYSEFSKSLLPEMAGITVATGQTIRERVITRTR